MAYETIKPIEHEVIIDNLVDYIAQGKTLSTYQRSQLKRQIRDSIEAMKMYYLLEA